MWLGIDVGGTKIEAAYSVGEEVASAGGGEAGDDVTLVPRLATPRAYAPFVDALVGLVEQVRAHEAGAEVEALTVGLPGQVEGDRVVWVPNLRFLDGKALGEHVRRRTGVRVYLANDAQLALLGEVWRGGAAGCRQAILFSLGTGVGGAFLVGGKILRGSHGSAGSLGWVNLDVDEPPDRQHGYLERHCSGAALDAAGRGLDPPRTAAAVVEGARAGDAACFQLLDELARRLGAGTASVASIFDPEVVLFSGGLTDAFDLLEGRLQETFSAFASPSTRRVPLVRAALGSHAGAYGAVRAAMLDGEIWL